MSIPFPTAFLNKKTVDISGVSSLAAIDETGAVVRVPRMQFYSRADLAASVLPDTTPGVYVERYTAGGPVVGMFYSLESTDQTSSDPTCMALTVKNAVGATSTKYTHLRNARVTPAMMGAPYDGTTDDAPFHNRALQYFSNCYADPKPYQAFIKTPVRVLDGCTLDMTGAATWLIDLVGSFTNFDKNNKFSDTGSIIQALGSISPDTPISGLRIRNVPMKPKVTQDSRITVGVWLRNVGDFIVEGLDMSGFAAGSGICVNDCGDNGPQIIRDNNIHDWYTNADFGGDAQKGQQTGIEYDKIRTLKGNQRHQIYGNTVKNLLKGSTGKSTANGYQADGVNITSNGEATYHQIHENTFEGVDEAIDCFACFNSIQNNKMRSCTGAGVKLIHGASDNLVSGNEMTNMSQWGVCLSSTTAGGVNNNKIHGNKIQMGNVGAAVATPVPIYLDETDAASHTTTNNVISDNHIDCAGLTTTNFHNGVTNATSRNYSVNDHIMQKGTSTAVPYFEGFYTNFFMERPVKRTRVRAKLNTLWTKTTGATSEKIPFDTAVFDDLSEFNATSKQIELWMQGYYSGRVGISGLTFPANNQATFIIKAVSPNTGTQILATKRVTYASSINNDIEFSFRGLFDRGSVVTVEVAFASGTGANSFQVNNVADSFMELTKD